MKNKKSKLIFIACVTIIISIIITADLYIKKSLPDNSILISKEEAEETAASYMNEIKKSSKLRIQI